jgi:cation diffusion facilitator CzcD-associated flavoprotein CzcO
MSHCLTAVGVDHVVLGRGEVVNSWRYERWDSLRLLAPNWMTQLVGSGRSDQQRLAGAMDDVLDGTRSAD